MDVTRPRGAERCHVTLHSSDPQPPRRRFWHRAPARHVSHRYDVALDELGALLAQPRPGTTTRLFTPRSPDDS